MSELTKNTENDEKNPEKNPEKEEKNPEKNPENDENSENDENTEEEESTYDASSHVIYGFQLKNSDQFPGDVEYEAYIEKIIVKLLGLGSLSEDELEDRMFEILNEIEIPGTNDEVGIGVIIPNSDYKIVSIYNHDVHDGVYITLKMYDHHVYEKSDTAQQCEIPTEQDKTKFLEFIKNKDIKIAMSQKDNDYDVSAYGMWMVISSYYY